MSYCDTHLTNNCLECAIDNQTKAIVNAIREANRKPPSIWQKIKNKYGKEDSISHR